MTRFRARVRNGRVVLDEPVDLPEGTILDLVPVGFVDALDEGERRALHASLLQSDEDLKAGRTIDADSLLRRLRTGE